MNARGEPIEILVEDNPGDAELAVSRVEPTRDQAHRQAPLDALEIAARVAPPQRTASSVTSRFVTSARFP